MKVKQVLLFLAFSLFFHGVLLGQLSGTLTINQNGTGDYPTIQKAIDALVSQGVSGPVTVSINPGTYEELLEINNIPGTSTINRVIFTSSNNKKEEVILNATLPITIFAFNVGHIKLKHVDFITFRNLTINTVDEIGTGSTFTFFGGNEFVQIDQCIISMQGQSVYGVFAPKALTNDFQSSDYGPNDLSISNNRIVGNFNYYTISEKFRMKDLIVIRNTIKCSSLSVTGIENFTFSKNLIEPLDVNSNGIFVNDLYGKNEISGNRFFETSTAINVDKLKSNIRIYNNFIKSWGTGIRLDTDSAEIYFNNFLIYDGIMGSSAINFIGGENNIIKNNILSIVGSGAGILFSSDPSANQNIINYNNYNAPDGLWMNTQTFPFKTYNSLSEIQNNFSSEQNGLAVNPAYISNDDLHINNGALKDAAEVIPGITVDYDGESRDALAPDIGADEISNPANIKMNVVSISPSSVKGKDKITITWTANNNGDAGFTDAWRDYIYLSQDFTLDENDLLLGETVQNNPLAIGESYTSQFTQEVEWNSDGQFYFIVHANAENLPGEDASDNIGISQPLNYEARDRSALSVNSISVPRHIASGTEITVSWVVTNNGEIPTNGTWEDYVYIARDSSYLEDSTRFNADSLMVVKAINVAGLDVGESYTSQAKYFIPFNGSGKLYAKVIPDGNNVIDEIIETRVKKSITSSSISVSQVPLADLIITEAFVQANAFSGEYIDLTYRIKNIGNAATAFDRRLDHIYLMTDSMLQDGKITDYLKFDELYITGEILPDSTATISTRFKLPFCNSGDFLFYIETDAEDIVFEFSDENNGFVTQELEVVLKPGPDFIIDNIRIVNDRPVSGQNITINYNVTNIGFDTASIFNNLFEGLWLCRTNTLDKKNAVKSILPINFDTLRLAEQKAISRTRYMYIPDSIYGEFYLFINADNGEKFCEDPYEENNLKRFGPFSIEMSNPVDLQITNVLMPTSAEAGKQINLTYQLKNNGTGDIINRNIKDSLVLFNSTDTVYIYGNEIQRTIFGGSFVQEDLLITIPYLTPPGNYKLALTTDCKDRLFEYNAENNNTTLFEGITISRNTNNLPDLELSNIKLQGLHAGDTLVITYTVTNLSQKETTTGFWIDKAYLIDPSDKVIFAKSIAINKTLTKGESYTHSIKVFLPIKTYGQFSFSMIADADKQMKEYDKENNTYQTPVNINLSKWADLSVEEFKYPTQLTAGQNAIFEWTVKNKGTRPTEKPYWSDKIFLSENNVYNKTDIRISNLAHEEVLQNSNSYNNKDTVRVSPYLSGEYYLIFSTDAKNQIFENGEEANNYFISNKKINIRRPAPVDLVPSITDIRFNGKQISYTLKNSSNNAVVGTWVDAIFISKDPYWDQADKLAGYHNIAPEEDILPGESIDLVQYVQLPVVRPGDYYIILKTDVYNYVPETNISNNTISTEFPVYIDEIEDLTNSTPLDTLFKFYSKNHYYQLKKPAGKGILLTLDAFNTSPITDVYYRTDDIPVAGGEFDYRGNNPLQTDQQIIVHSVDSATDDFILAEADYLDDDYLYYSILAEEKEFSIVDIYPKRGSKYGTVVIDLEGFDFSDSISVIFRNDNDATVAVHSYLVEPTLARAHVNLNDLSPGIYDVVLRRNDRGDETTLSEIFTVEEEVVEDLYVDIVAPEAMRIYREENIQINFANYGNLNDYDVFLYISFYRSDFNMDGFDIQYLGDGVSDKLPPEVAAFNDTGDGVFINDGKAFHFVTWLPVFASQGRGQYSFSLKGNVEDTIFVNATFFRNDITPIHLSGNLNDLKYTQFMRDIEKYLDGNEEQNENPIQLKSANTECILEPEKVEAMIWKGVRSHAEYVSGGIPGNPTAVVSSLLQEGLKSYVNPDAHLNAKDLAKDLTDDGREINLNPTEKSSYDHLIRNLDNCLTPEVVDNVKDRCLIVKSEQYLRENNTYGTRYVHTFNCPEKAKQNAKKGKKKSWISILFPKDPNDITGPSGKGSARFVTNTELLPYKIRFENVSTATASALNVDIDNPLGENFDPRKFRLDKIGWGDTIIQLPSKSYFNGEFELGPRFPNQVLRLVAGVDPLNHRVFWNFATINPNTGASPSDPNAGFLPPNDSSGVGEGFVTYTIESINDPVPGSLLENQAVIVFDQEESLATNLWVNTISGDGTESFVNELPETIDTSSFIVSWDYLAGTEFSPIPQSYTIFVATNEEPYQKWINKTTEKAALFNGVDGNTYHFFSIAEFEDGLQEATPVYEDAQTKILLKEDTVTAIGNTTANALKIYPNPSEGKLVIEYKATLEGEYTIYLYDVAGRELRVLFQGTALQGKNTLLWKQTNFIPKGIYMIRLKGHKLNEMVKWVKH